MQVLGLLFAGLILWLGWPSLRKALELRFVWIGKDIVLYPVVRHAFAPSRPPRDAPVVVRGVVDTLLHPHGLVRVEEELWQAEP